VISPGVPVRVLIADDQLIAASGTAQFLAGRNIETCATISDPRSLGTAYAKYQPDVVIIDTAMGRHRAAWSAIAALMKRQSSAAVLVLSGQLTAASVHAALDLGCTGVIPKTCTIDALESAVHDVARGERHLHPLVVALLLADMHKSEPRHALPELSRRELGVLVLIADGLGNIEIGRQVGIGEATVKTHVANIMRKLNAHDRAHAASTALRLGLIV
jgi:two-component system, NarL family, response regulator